NLASTQPGLGPTLDQTQHHQLQITALPDQVLNLECGLDLFAVDQTLTGEMSLEEMRTQAVDVRGDDTAVIAAEFGLGPAMDQGLRQSVSESFTGQKAIMPSSRQSIGRGGQNRFHDRLAERRM